MRNQIGPAPQVCDPTIFFGVIACQAQCEVVAGREIDGAFEDAMTALAHVKFRIPLGLIDVRLCSDDVYAAADRVPAEQESLWSAQDLGSFNVEKTDNPGSGSTLV